MYIENAGKIDYRGTTLTVLLTVQSVSWQQKYKTERILGKIFLEKKLYQYPIKYSKFIVC